MKTLYGPIAQYADPALTQVDTSEEVVLNTYPDGAPQGRIQASSGVALKDFHASMWDENFFRKHILKNKLKDTVEDRARVTDYALNSCVIGFTLLSVRYLILPL